MIASDMIASDGLDPGQRAAAEQLTGCTTGTITAGEYRDLLLRSGFRITGPGGTEPGAHTAVIRAVRPAAPAGSSSGGCGWRTAAGSAGITAAGAMS
jgi:hypothetical protein